MLKNYFMRISGVLCTIGTLTVASQRVLADTDNPTTSDAEKVYLVQIINQLDAMQPLILAAKNAQLSDKRVQFHYHRYRDNQGKLQNGLLEDVQSIKLGITQYLDQPAIEPRSVQPLQGDYLNLKPIPNNQNNLVAPNMAEVPNADG